MIHEKLYVATLECNKVFKKDVPTPVGLKGAICKCGGTAKVLHVAYKYSL